jgi:hypothetical protein
MTKPAPSPAEPIHVAGTRPDLLCCTPSTAERCATCGASHDAEIHQYGMVTSGHPYEPPKTEAASEVPDAVDEMKRQLLMRTQECVEFHDEARRARAEVAAKTEECALHESAARKNLATIVAAEARAAKLEKALREIAIRTGQWEARAIDCQEIAAAALKATP